MVKTKLLGVGKSERRCYFIFPKKQELFKILRQFLLDAGVKKFDADSFARPTDEKHGEPIYDKEDDIKDYVDKHYSFSDEAGEYVIEIIFGKDKTFLIIFSKVDRQEEISNIMNKFIED